MGDQSRILRPCPYCGYDLRPQLSEEKPWTHCPECGRYVTVGMIDQWCVPKRVFVRITIWGALWGLCGAPWLLLFIPGDSSWPLPAWLLIWAMLWAIPPMVASWVAAQRHAMPRRWRAAALQMSVLTILIAMGGAILIPVVIAILLGGGGWKF